MISIHDTVCREFESIDKTDERVFGGLSQKNDMFNPLRIIQALLLFSALGAP